MTDSCSVEVCSRPVYCRGYCTPHYMWAKYYNFERKPTHKVKRRAAKKGCKVDGCDRPYKCRGYCASHYAWARRRNFEDEPTHNIDDTFADNSGECIVECCERGAEKRKMCSAHYVWSRERNFEVVPTHPVGDGISHYYPDKCKVEGCNEDYRGLGYCNKHYLQIYRANNRVSMNDNAARYYSRKRCCRPPWANDDAIDAVYEKAQWLSDVTGVRHEVDHIIPLQHDLVCGLHVSGNLQILPSHDNRVKSNKFNPDNPDEYDVSQGWSPEESP